MDSGRWKDIDEMKKFVGDYSKNMYGEKWKLGLSLSFKWSYREFKYLENWMDKLKLYMLGSVGVVLFDGIYVGEYNRNGDLGLHSVLYYEGDVNDSKVKNSLYKWCVNKGSVDIFEFKEDEGFDWYMNKHLYRGFENNWNMINNKIQKVDIRNDRNGRYIYIVNRDSKSLDKLYLDGKKESLFDIDDKELNKLNKIYDWKSDEDNLGFWKYRGKYSSIDRRNYKSNKGKGKLWRVEDNKLKYFENKSWFVVSDDWDDDKFGVIGDSGYKWILNGRKKSNLFNIIRRYGVWLIGMMILGRILYKLFNVFRYMD